MAHLKKSSRGGHIATDKTFPFKISKISATFQTVTLKLHAEWTNQKIDVRENSKMAAIRKMQTKFIALSNHDIIRYRG